MNNSRRSKAIDFLQRLIAIDLGSLFLQIRWAFETELYRKEFNAAFEAIEREEYVLAKEILEKIALILGDNHPQVIYLGTAIYLFE